jgi:hypothetical protein
VFHGKKPECGITHRIGGKLHLMTDEIQPKPQHGLEMSSDQGEQAYFSILWGKWQFAVEATKSIEDADDQQNQEDPSKSGVGMKKCRIHEVSLI